jgi:penicillin-binding protein 2
LKILAFLVTLMFAALTTRLWYLQVLASQDYVKIVNNTSFRQLQVEPERGRILSANGEPLVENRLSRVVTVQQQLLGDDPEAVLFRLAQHLEVPAEDIVKEMANLQYFDYQRVPVAVDVPEDKIFYIAEHPTLFPGVSWDEQSVRRFPEGPLASHVLGQVGLIGEEQVDDPAYDEYGPNDTIGVDGLEATYERFLHGTAGTEKIVVDPAGQLLEELGGQLPVPGYDVRLYLNTRTQRIVERNLLEGIQRARSVEDGDDENDVLNLVANAGAVVVLDPETFGVEASASWPTFDPNWFVKGMTERENRERIRSPEAGKPLFDRAIQGAYAPGSTFKPFVALSALKNGVTSAGGSTDCPAEWAYPLDPDKPFSNWSAFPQGFLSVPEALKVSCDTVFYQWGAEFYDRWRANQLGTGSEPLQRDLRGFGFGHEPGLDVPSQAGGFIPDAAWKQEQHEQDDRAFPYGWLPGDDILMSIGQGYVLTSPLQVAAAYASIVNGGTLCEPRLAEQIQDAEGKRIRRIGSECRKLQGYTQQELDLIQDGLRGVVQSGGTAAGAFSDFPFARVPVMGKTGTAERPGFTTVEDQTQGQDTSWFAAIVGPPGDQHVIVAMVEQGGHGSETAAPIVRRIIEDMYALGDTGPAQIVPTD